MVLIVGLAFLCSTLAVEANAPKREKGKKVELAAAEPAAAPSEQKAEKSWQNKWETVVKEAKKESKVVVYAGAVSPTLREAISKAVRSKFGVMIEFVAGRGAAIAQKLIVERRAGLYLADIVIMGADSALTLKENGVFAPLAPSFILPEVTDPKSWPNSTIPYFDREHLLFPLTVGYQSYVIVNTNLVKEGEINSYLNLLDPKWKGKVVLSDPNVGGGSGINWATFMLKHALGLEEGKKYLQQLVSQDLAVIQDNRLQVEGTARGKWAIAIGPTVALVSEFIKAGAPIKWLRMKEGGSLAPTASILGMADKAANPNAATVMVNWLLSNNGQTVFSSAYGQPATRLGIASKGIEPGRVALPKEKTYLVNEDFVIFSKDVSIKITREVFK